MKNANTINSDSVSRSVCALTVCSNAIACLNFETVVTKTNSSLKDWPCFVAYGSRFRRSANPCKNCLNVATVQRLPDTAMRIRLRLCRAAHVYARREFRGIFGAFIKHGHADKDQVECRNGELPHSPQSPRGSPTQRERIFGTATWKSSIDRRVFRSGLPTFQQASFARQRFGLLFRALGYSYATP